MPVLVNRLLHRSFRQPDHPFQKLFSAAAAKNQSKNASGDAAVAQHKEKEDDDLLDDDDDDDSLLSEPEWRDYWEKQEYNNSLGYFQRRERLLNRILRQYDDENNPHHVAFCQQIQRRERAVRLLHYKYDQPPRHVKAKQHMVMTELIQVMQDRTRTGSELPPSYQSSWKDFWMFEWHSSIPAVYCLVLHSIAFSALEDFVRSSFGGTSLAFVFGVILLRFTGDLFWFLDDDTYDALRVDFDNRQRLGDTEMCWSKQIRRRPILRAIFFMVGYPICYMAAGSFNESVEKYFFNQYESIVSNLPSKLHEERYGTCPATVSFCSWACQEYLRERDDTTAIQAKSDLIYTWKTLSFAGYEEFWYASIDVSYVPEIYENRTHFFYSIWTVIVAITFYWFLVGGKFWEKY